MKLLIEKIKRKYIHYVDRILFKYYSRKLISQGRKTSISDDDEYPVVCYIASQNNRFFSRFRRNSTYNDILEHVTREQGQEYLNIISRNNRLNFSDSDWNNFHQNDAYGNPIVFPYHINGKTFYFSPTTLRYAKVLQDIATLFDVDQIHSVAEIGIGYAGECRMLTSYLSAINTYSLFDLPEVLALAGKYLSKFGKDTIHKIKFIDGTTIDTNDSYDFVISNYAFSELIRSIQDSYLDKVILKSKAGYITWNTLSYEKLDGYSVEELLQKIPGSTAIEEKPLTQKGNCIIIWGNRP